MIEFLGIKYTSHLWVASGTYGWGIEAFDGGFLSDKIGAIVTKGVSPLEMVGAPHPRIAEVNGSAAILNAIGLQNPGVDKFLSEYVPTYQNENFKTPIWVNVFASSVGGYIEVMEKILNSSNRDWLYGFELNVSCPNVDKGGAEFASDKDVLTDLIKKSKAISDVPVMVKMSPMLSNAQEIAKCCESAGADCLSISNTMLAGLPEPEKNSWSLGRRFGGMSGPALKPISLRLTQQISESVNIPLCGIGGIAKAHDVQEFLQAGASIVQIGTANFANPWVVDDIYAQL